ncbi:DDE transposase family protein [Brumimicrobium mesophilum]|uniref:DDE transposase family protein n=1 Tax=Brumimicrobium mesophilum TaxID=392717 RepID=UPI000D1426C7|nr:DDE transposase family protein [Brumimicrobium mesophilum]
MRLQKQQQHDYAKTLYTSENLTQKEIATRVKVTEKTVSRWIEKGEWKKLRKSMLITKQHQISQLYDQLEFLNLKITERDYKVAEAKEADVISKITSAIQKLEVETSIGQIVEVARDFIDFVREIDLEEAKKITNHFDLFIQSKMK